MTEISERQLMARAAWLYYLGGLNQEETSSRMGLTRARVNRLLRQARASGLVSISIDHRDIGLLPVENAIQQEFGLQFCICTPPLGLSPAQMEDNENLSEFPQRAVGSTAAHYLRDLLASKPDAVIGTGWGRTLNQITRNLAGAKAPKARFISLMGSLTANSAFNPFEVVQALAHATGAEGYFLPVPFIADTKEDREVLLSQHTVARSLEMARHTDLALISIGELTETSLLRQQSMITQQELADLRKAGAVGDTNGIFFDDGGHPVKHSLNDRTLAVSFDDLKRSTTVILSAGPRKVEATCALLRSGVGKGLIIDGDSALLLVERLKQVSA
ncbi:MAG TPA: sugar-binding transcriptional regulator [Devosia sp.]|nr:sugar-binding transcriptional regulator [Devosia sp.]